MVSEPRGEAVKAHQDVVDSISSGNDLFSGVLGLLVSIPFLPCALHSTPRPALVWSALPFFFLFTGTSKPALTCFFLSRSELTFLYAPFAAQYLYPVRIRVVNDVTVVVERHTIAYVPYFHNWKTAGAKEKAKKRH